MKVITCADCIYYKASGWKVIDGRIEDDPTCDCVMNIIKLPKPIDYCSKGEKKDEEVY